MSCRMDCEKVAQMFFEYLDKALCQEDASGLKEHLDMCRQCFDRVEFEKRLRAHMAQKTDHKCPESLKSRIKDIIEKF